MGRGHRGGERRGVVLAAAAVTLGLALVVGVTAVAYARNPDQPGVASEQQDLLDGLTVAALGWLGCLVLLGLTALRATGPSRGSRRPMPPARLLLAAVGLGLLGSVAELTGQGDVPDRLSLVVWSETFYVVGAVCLVWTMAVALECGVLAPDRPSRGGAEPLGTASREPGSRARPGASR